MKRIVSVILCIALVSGCLVFSAGAQDAYPESAHNYANNACETWEYVYPGEADALSVTFSEDTYLNGKSIYYYITDGVDETYVTQFLEEGFFETGGDYLEIRDADDTLRYTIRGGEYAGKTVFLKGNRFTITLYSDYDCTAYGFRITDISPHSCAAICYEIDGDSFRQDVFAGETLCLDQKYAMRQYGDRMIVGWKTESGEEYYYDNTSFWLPNGNTDRVLQGGEICTLYPIWCPIGLRKEEVFSFINSDEVFNAEVKGYPILRSHFLRILPNWLVTFAFSPFAPIAALYLFIILFYNPISDFGGSCAGFSAATLLQHYGKIDMLSEQGVSNVCDLQPDETVISTLDYYQYHGSMGLFVNHIALEPGTPTYSSQLRALYETAASGKPIYMELDSHNRVRQKLKAFQAIVKMLKNRNYESEDSDNGVNHAVVVTGAYTDGNGNHILIMYDNNSTKYVKGTCDILYIDPNFTQLYSDYGKDNILEGFGWNEEVDMYDSFKIDGAPNPVSWHKEFLKNFPSTLPQVIRIIFRFITEQD